MWTVLRSFESEPEARVVEAFLKAHDIDVQLLGTHTTTSAVAPGSLRSGAMRMMVRQDQADTAKTLLKEAESRAHLSVVSEHTPATPPKIDTRYDRILIVLLLIAMAIVGVLTWR